jgi:putative flippase GtrA
MFPFARCHHLVGHQGAMRQLVSFVVVGALNTGLTYVLYLLFLLIGPYWLAYTLSYLAGIVFSAFANSTFVFASSLTMGIITRYGLLYSSSYLVGLGLLVLCVRFIGIPEALAPLLVVGVMIPVNFLVSRFALTGHWSRRG